ncbi:MAG: MaoC protein [Caulobacteraceae bacterium]|nr:MaoC protein [Caulobacteraceae bacterium]
MAKDRYFDEIEVGEVWQSDPVTITQEEIVAYALEYDPQAFHLTEEGGRASMFGGIIASGWQLTAIMMREMVKAKPEGDVAAIGRGVDKLRWLRPVRPDDRLVIRREMVAKQLSSRGDRGILEYEFQLTNQHGEPVMTLSTSVLSFRGPTRG